MTASAARALHLPDFRMPAPPNPFGRPSRAMLIVALWMGFTMLQAALLIAAATGPRRSWAFFGLYGSIGIAWALLTFPIGAMTRAARLDRGLGRAVAIHLAGLLICGVVDTIVRRQVAILLGGALPLPWYGTLLYFADRTFVGYLVMVLLARALEAHDRFVARERQALALQAQLARARLSSLEEQLHPHFLFNCLGAVTELAHEAPAAAARMLNQLASVLRFALQRGGGEVTVAEEVAALEPYLEVQRTRFADWITIHCEVDAAAKDLLLPPLVLQPLVENAIRHGLEQRDAAGQIRITAAVRDDTLVVEVRDNGVGLRAPRPGVSRGIGTANVRDRLAALYAADADLMLFEDERGGAVSRLTIPAHRQRESVAPPAPVSDDVTDAPSVLPRILRERPILGIIVAWAAWGFLWTEQSIAYMAFRGRLGDRSFTQIAMHDFATAMLWAAVTPLMLLALRLVPLRPGLAPLRLAAHAAFALSIAALHGWLTQLVLDAPFGILSFDGVAALGWGILAYAVVLAVAYQGQIRSWLRERELADSRTRVSIAEAELSATTARARPQQLLERLESIAQSVQSDAAGAERALTRLADQLRDTLDARIPA